MIEIENQQADLGAQVSDLTELQNTILNSINRICDNETVKKYLNNFIDVLAAKNNEEYSNLEGFKIVIRNTIFSSDFWNILFNNFSDIINLIKCTYDTEYINAVADQKLSDAIAKSDNVKLFIYSLDQNKDKITSAISYMMNLPIIDDKKILDKVFMAEVVNFLTKNQDAISQEDIKELTRLSLERKGIELTGSLPGRDKAKIENTILNNTLKFSAKLLEILSKTKDLDKLVATKKSIIAKFLTENIPLNGMTEVMTEKAFERIIEELLDTNKIQTNFSKLQEIVETLIEKNEVYDQFINFKPTGIDIKLQKTSLQSFIQDNNKITKIIVSEVDKKFFNDAIDNPWVINLKQTQNEIAGAISQKYIMKMGQLGMELMNAMPNTLNEITNVHNHGLFFSQCFAAKSEDGKIKYTLSSMGQSLLLFGFMKFGEENHVTFSVLETDEQKQEFLKNWSIEVNGKDALKKDDFEDQILNQFDTTLLRDALPTMTTETTAGFAQFLKSFNAGQDMFTWFPILIKTVATNDRFKGFVVQYKNEFTAFAKKLTPDESMQKLNLDKDQLFKPEFIGDLMEAIDSKAAIQFGAFMDDLRNEMPVFTWMPKMLQAAATNKDLAQALIRHKDTISYLAGQMSESAINDFGLSKEFMKKIVTCTLKDQKSIELGYNLFCALASENYAQMAGYTFELLNHNQGLQDLLKDIENHKEIASLMQALGLRNETIKEYFQRFEFNGLKTGINPLMVDILPGLIGFINPPNAEESLLKTLNKLMANNGIPNGIGLSKEANANSERLRMQAIDAVYMYSINAKTFDDVRNDIAILGITTEDELKTKIEEGQVNDQAVKLCNEILSVFKADLPEKDLKLINEEDQVKYQTKVAAIKAAQASELKTMVEIINGNGNIYDDINSAVQEDKLSPKNADFLKIRFNQYFNQLPAKDGTLLLKRVSHELRLKSFEEFGVQREDGVVVNSIHSGVFFELARRLAVQLGDKNINQDKLQELIKNNTDVFSKDQIEQLSGIIMNGTDESSKADILDILNDLAYRRKNSEDIGNIQDLLNSVFAPFAALTKLPYSIDMQELNSALEKIEDKQYSNEEIKEFLTETLRSCSNIESLMKDFVEKDDLVIIDENDERIESKSQDELRQNLSSVKSEYDQTIKIVNKLLGHIPQNPNLMHALNTVISQKGDVSSLDKSLLVKGLQDLLLSLDKKEDRQTLNKLIISIAYSRLDNPYHVQALADNLKKLEDPVNDQEITQFLSNAISAYQDLSKNKLKALQSIGQVLKVLPSAAVQYFTSDLPRRDEHVKKFKEIVEALRENESEINIRGILRREFQPMSVRVLSGQDLGEIDLSNTKGLDGISFFKTNLSNVKFNNVNFIKCMFEHCELPSPEQLSGATFDIESFTTFITNAEAKKIDIMSYLNSDIKVQTNVSKPLSAVDAYRLIKAAEAKKIKLTDQAVLDTASPVADGKHSLFDNTDLSHLKVFDMTIILEAWYKQRTMGNLNTSEVERDNNLTTEAYSKKAQYYRGIEKDKFVSDLTKAIAYKLSYEIYLHDGDLLDDAEKIYDSVYKNLRNLSNEDRQKIEGQLDDVATKIYNAFYKISEYKDIFQKLKILSNKSDNIKDIINIEFSIRKGESPEIWREISHAVNMDKLELLIGKDDILKLMIDYSTRTKGNISDVISKVSEFERVDQIIKSAQELEKHRDELYGLNLDVLDVIKEKIEIFAQRSAVDIQKRYIWNGQDNSFHNQIYELNAEGLETILDISWILFNHLKDKAKTKPLSEILESNKGKISVVDSIVKDVELMKPYIDTLFTTDKEVLELINANKEIFYKLLEVAKKYGVDRQSFVMNKVNLEALLQINPVIFKQMASYCSRSGKTLDEMLEHKDILENLEKLSKELEDRYKLAGEKNPEKFCLNLVVKLYNDMATQLRNLVKNDDCHSIVASLAFSAINRVKLDPNNAKQVEEFSQEIIGKINSDHTTVLARKAIKQGQKIASDVFAELNVQYYLGDKTKESQENFANIIASRIFASGKVIKDTDLKGLIGEVKPVVGYFSTKYTISTGLVKAFLDIYGTTTSYNYVQKFDKDRTTKMIDSIDQVISGKLLQQSIAK